MQFVPVTHHASGRGVWRTLVVVFAGLLTLGVFTPFSASAHTAALLRVNDKVVTETDSGTTTVHVKLVLSRAVHHQVSVSYNTVNGTAKAGKDYVAGEGRVYFHRDARVAFLHVQLLGDKLDEPNEYFKVHIYDAHHARITDHIGVVKILDNDAAPTVSISDPKVVAGQDATVKISLSAPSGKWIAVEFATVNGTAKAGKDYVQKAGVVTFAPGNTCQKVLIMTKADADKTDETFSVKLLDAKNATIKGKPAIVTITPAPAS